MTFVTDIQPTEYLSFYKPYIEKAGDLELIRALELSKESTISFFKSIDDNKWSYRYLDDKWSIKEILQHLIDSERVFAYRALRFSRNDKTNLPGFDENAYAYESNGNIRRGAELIEEYIHLRNATLSLFKSFTKEMLIYSGFANDAEMSVRAIGFVIVGHEKHHIGVIKERYL